MPTAIRPGFNYDGAEFLVAAVPRDVRDLRQERTIASTAILTAAAAGPDRHRTTVSMPTTAAIKTRARSRFRGAPSRGGGIPSSFVFFGYLTSSGGYVYGQAPTDNPGAFIGTNATATQYYAVVNTGNGTSTPPFSLEQPAGFSAADKAGFLHDTFDPFYRDQEGAVTENTHGHTALPHAACERYLGRDGSRLYLRHCDRARRPARSIRTCRSSRTSRSTAREYDVWKTTLTMPSTTSVYYYKFQINRDQTNGFYSDDYLDDNDNVHKDGTGTATDGEPFQSFQFTVYDPNFQTPAWLQNANVYHILPDRFRNGDQTNDYCRAGIDDGMSRSITASTSQRRFTTTRGTSRSAIPTTERSVSGCIQQPVLRRRSAGHPEQARLPAVAGCGHDLHEPDLPGAVEPPLRHRSTICTSIQRWAAMRRSRRCRRR